MSADRPHDQPSAPRAALEGVLEGVRLLRTGAPCVILETPPLESSAAPRTALVTVVAEWDSHDDAGELALAWQRSGPAPAAVEAPLPELGRLELAIGHGLTIVLAASPVDANTAGAAFRLVMGAGPERVFLVRRLRYRVDLAHGTDLGGLEALVRGLTEGRAPSGAPAPDGSAAPAA